MKIIGVVGTRPNYMKIAPIQKAFAIYPDIQFILVHTGQHYDYNMNKVFFEDLKITEPDYYLEARSTTVIETTANILVKFDAILAKEKPDLVLVVGDVDSTLASALVASKRNIKIAHIEAGLRSNDRNMPEEINRILTDQLSDYLFTTEAIAMSNLIREGITEEKVFFVGNVMIDTLKSALPFIQKQHLDLPLLATEAYIVTTFHRVANVDNSTSLKRIIHILKAVSQLSPIIFPIHPRTKKRLLSFGLYQELEKIQHLHIVPPMGYFNFIKLLKGSRAILTDSGGIQSEAAYLGIPCLTLRDSTEHIVTLEKKVNFLIPSLNLKKIIEILKTQIRQKHQQVETIPNWDGAAATRIAQILHEKHNKKR